MSLALQTLQAQLAAAGKNYIRLDQPDGDVRTTTTGVFSRWRARNPDPEARRQNQTTVNALVDKLRGVEGYGDRLADLVAGRMSTLCASGQPLSGREVAQIVSQANNEARDVYLRKESVALAVRDIVAQTTADGLTRNLFFVSQTTPDGLITTLAGDLVRDLGVTEIKLSAWVKSIQEMVKIALTAKADQTGRTPTEAEVKQAIVNALLHHYVKSFGEDILGVVGFAVCTDDFAPTVLEAMPELLERLLREAGSCVRDAYENAGTTSQPRLYKAFKDKSEQLIRNWFRERTAQSVNKSIPLVVADDSSFCQAVNQRIQQRDPGIAVSGKALTELAKIINKQMAAHLAGYAERRPLANFPSAREIDLERDRVLDNYFAARIDAYVQHPGLSDAERNAARAALLKSMLPLDPNHFDTLQLAQRAAGVLFKTLAVADSVEETRANLEDFLRDYDAVNAGLPRGSTIEDFQPVVFLAFSAALEEVDGDSALLSKLLAPGSAFLRSVRQAVRGTYKEMVIQQALIEKLKERLASPQNPWLQSTYPIDADFLPLRFRPHLQREGAVNLAARLKDPATLEAWRQNERRAIVEYGTYSNVRNKVLHPTGFADPNDPRWTLGSTFSVDLPRDGFLVNGTLVNSEAEFLGLMPDRRTAAQVSRVLHQGLAGVIIIEAPPELRDLLLNATSTAPLGAGDLRIVAQRGSATSLGDGAYRITYEAGFHVRQMSDVTLSPGVPTHTDYRGVIGFTLHTGAEFRISDVEVDAMVLALPPS